MYEIILNIHHYLAFVALALLAWATINGIMGVTSEKIFEESHRKANLFALISVHTMLLLGLILLVVSPGVASFISNYEVDKSNSVLRKMYMVHPTINIIAVILVTIGNVKSKKAIGNGSKFKFTAIFYGIGLLLILSQFPWARIF
jgi:uncharacterized membrane protein YqhA